MGTGMVRTLIAGNWKMNGLNSSLKEVEAIVDRLSGLADGADILLCPPATMIGGEHGRRSTESWWSVLPQ
jgi:triosephosphate isomerase